MNIDNIAELLKPRYLVIADYPVSPFNTGQVIEFTDVDFKDRPIYNMGIEVDEIVWVKPDYFNQYPHLFRKLEWWENRKVEEMPEYIRFVDTNMIVKVDFILPDIGFNFFYGESSGYGKRVFSNNVLPATELEYTTYINHQKQSV